MTSQKVWLVTEASRGLGRALAEEILGTGDLLVATAQNLAELEPLVRRYGNEMRAVTLDVRNSKQVEVAPRTALESFGRLDVLVNNASYGVIDAIRTMTEDEFRRNIDSNFWGVVHSMRAALPIMRAQGFGDILQITSACDHIGTPDISGYGAVKSAIERLSEALALETRMLGINVSIVEVGSFNSDVAVSSQIREDSAAESFNKPAHILRTPLQTAYSVSGDIVGAALAILELTKGSFTSPPSSSTVGRCGPRRNQVPRRL